ncbi:MAG: tetrathionate reductase family octaheme c-type cytochrome, partial [Leptospiraceae bacterium]|nr:tetrathionate reductase family octaheme c-type cytochrome [Leptospiraceae bacterium]
NNVKHGDLEQSLLSADRDVDVHMASNGMDMSCVTCHTAKNHIIKGKLYSVSSENINRATCEQCHTTAPHQEEVLNRHFEKVACQTCHIPTYAKVNKTKMNWKWSEAGKLKDGKPYHIEDEEGNHTYLSIKGEFKWEKNVKPEYVWFNGTAEHYFLGDKVKDDERPVQINKLNGSYHDRDSKIVPVKVHRGDQIWDPVNKLLIQPKLYDSRKGTGAFWTDFEWDAAAREGMKRVGLPYSGKYDFIQTEMYWPVNHMVSTKDKSLTCNDCHTRSAEGRLAKLTDFYLPGRDRFWLLDFLGKLAIVLTILGVMGHGFLRMRPWLETLRKKK